MLTTTEMAKVLKVSTARVRQMILTGAITAEKHGRDLFIPQSQIAVAKSRKTTPGRPKKAGAK